MNPKLFHAGGLKPRDIPLGMSLGFRRKAQVRTKPYSKMQYLHLTISLRFAIINYICI